MRHRGRSLRYEGARCVRNGRSRYTPRARPSASKPGPRLALEAGTRTEAQGIRQLYNASHAAYLISRISFSLVFAAESILPM